ncbi:DUF3185 family protein [Colwellia sp. 20A7]|uniref:DUF3185 family protein n=1 Tax=Colwellia sp. 20A7 TaxID=2689569 RepID=UPI00135A96D8|nr:DUF3185 family protein [Colwellia sp. 20A7]
MNNRTIGVILIIAGAALGLWGYDIYDSASSQLSRTLNGDTPIEAWAGMAGGAIAVLAGIIKIK